MKKVIPFLGLLLKKDADGKASLSVLEGVNNDGATTSFPSIAATTTVQSVPAAAGNVIEKFMFAISGKNVQISADGGTTFFNVPDNSVGTKEVKGGITQLEVQTSTGSATVDLWIDFKEN